MRTYRLSELAKVLGAELHGEDLSCDGLSWDSRNYDSRPGRIFVAIVGERHDGHDYLDQLQSKGLRMAITHHPVEGLSCLVVRDSLKALQSWAKQHRASIHQPVIGITGSYGKTEIKDKLSRLLEGRMSVCRSPRSYNSQLGLPVSLLSMEAHHELGIFEAGVSQAGEMMQLQDILRPDFGIFTALGEAHDEGFESRRQKLQEKLELFQAAQGIIYPGDEQDIHRAIQERYPDAEHYHWGRSEGAWLHILELEEHHGRVRMEYCTRGSVHQMEWHLPNGAYLDNELHCITALTVLGLSTAEIEEALQSASGQRYELVIMVGENGQPLLVDNDLLDGPSLTSALDHLDRNRTGENTAVILYQSEGSVANDRRLQELSDIRSHRSAAEQWIGIGSALRPLAERLGAGMDWYGNQSAAESRLRELAVESDQILLKGIWDPGFPALRSLLESVSHPTELQIDMAAIVHNLNEYRRCLLPGTRILVMVKAFAYGSGDSEVAHLLAHQGVDYLGVAYPSEGVALRKRGIRCPIMVLHAEAQSVPDLIHHQLEPQIFSLAQVDAMAAAIPEGKELGVHLEFDTGMHRLGFAPEDANAVLDCLQAHPSMRLRSVFSHLLASDDPAGDAWNRAQFQLFKQLHAQVTSHPYCKEQAPIFHILNSSGIARFPAQQYDMVRLGIGVYGYPGDSTMRARLQPALRWITRVSQVRRVPAGETVGYGGRFQLEKDTDVAVIPVGYADGLSRTLGQGRSGVIIRGELCPFIGNICMDMSMVDVTGLGIEAGEEVELFGPQRPMELMAADLGTIAYEVMAGIPQRVKRRYVNNRSV